jgi:hypothetical protein
VAVVAEAQDTAQVAVAEVFDTQLLKLSKFMEETVML